MRGIVNSIVGSLFVSLIFIGCGEEEEVNLHNPEFNMISSVENHAMIFSYDFMTLMEKSEVRNSSDMPMEMKFAMNMYIGNMLNSANMGIRLEGNNHVVVTTKENGEFDFGFLTAEVVSETKIKNGVKDFFKGKTSQKDGINYIQHKYSETVAAWDSTHIVFIYSEDREVDLKVKAKAILDSRKVDGKENKILEDFLSREDDMNMLVYLDKWMKFIQSTDKKVELDKEFLSLFDDAYMIGSGNFVPGKMVFEMEVKADKLKESKYNMLPNKTISGDFMKYLSDDGELILFELASVNPDAFFDVISQHKEIEKDFYQMLEKEGIKENDVREMFTGEFSASLVRMNVQDNPFYEIQASLIEEDFFADMEETYIPNPKVIPDPVYIVTIGLKNPERIKTLFDNNSLLKKKGNCYSAGNEGFLIVNDNKLIITSEKEFADVFGSGKELPEYKIDGGISTPLFGQLTPNIESFPEELKELIVSNGGSEGEELLKFMKEFERVTFTGNFDKMKMEVIMINKEINSLEVVSSKLVKQVIQNMSLFM